MNATFLLFFLLYFSTGFVPRSGYESPNQFAMQIPGQGEMSNSHSRVEWISPAWLPK
jgi:hypothetical protein